MDKVRRMFFKDYFIRDTVKLIQEAREAFQEEKARADYFESFETAYPLISETMLFMDDEVEKLGIDIKGKTKLKIVEEIYSKRNKVNKAQ
jgi:hypothetical protein